MHVDSDPIMRSSMADVPNANGSYTEWVCWLGTEHGVKVRYYRSQLSIRSTTHFGSLSTIKLRYAIDKEE